MSCVAPVVMRSNGIDSAIPLPQVYGPNSNTQDPDKCKVRAIPNDAAMSEEERIKYDPVNYLHGSEIFEVP